MEYMLSVVFFMFLLLVATLLLFKNTLTAFCFYTVATVVVFVLVSNWC